MCIDEAGVQYGANQCEAPFLVTSEELLPRIARLSDKFQHIRNVIYIRNRLVEKDNPKTASLIETLRSRSIDVDTYDEVMERGSKLTPIEYVNPDPNDVSLIMYTSGTTGDPKGVMLTHFQIGSSLQNMLRLQEEMKIPLTDTIYAGYLPMAHIYGYLLNLGCFFSDCSLALCSPMTMLDSSPAHEKGQIGDFNLIKPQFLSTVPLVLERIMKEIYRKLESRTPISAPIFTYLMDYKIRWQQRGYDTPITNRLACKKINDQFGGNLELMIVGSAPLSERTQAFIQAALNIRLIQGLFM